MVRSQQDIIYSKVESLSPTTMQPEEIADGLLDVLSKIEDDAIRLTAHEARYREEEVKQLWKEARRFLEGLPSLVSFHARLSEYENKEAPNGAWSRKIQLVPWGVMLVVLPANAIVPLSVIIPAALIAGGNRVVVAVSSAGRKSGVFILNAISKVLGDSMLVWEESVRTAIASFVDDEALVDALYYIGSSKHFAEIARLCAASGVTLLYEGEGRSLAVIDDLLPNDDLRRAAQMLAQAKVFCRGCMCSAPNVALIPNSIFDAFNEIYHKVCEKLGRVPTSETYLSPSQLETIARQDVRFGAHKPPQRLNRVPTLFYWNANLQEAFDLPELFCPGLVLARAPDLDACLQAVAAQRFRLQVALYSRRPEILEKLIKTSCFARYCLQISPVAQDSLMPWGNYGYSGYSDVVDFYRKGLRRIIIETACNEGDLI